MATARHFSTMIYAFLVERNTYKQIFICSNSTTETIEKGEHRSTKVKML